MDVDLILRGGLVDDGSANPPRIADVAIAAGRIVHVGTSDALAARETVDATGLRIAPGFVDMHSHSDVALIVEPENLPKIRQGITFELIGQDGLGVAPFNPAADANWRRSLIGVTGHREHPWTWRTFDGHLRAIEAARPANNVGAFVGYGAVRNAVLGLGDRIPTAHELDRICGMIDDAMAAGAFGMSVGLVYSPAVFAAFDELVRAFAVVGRRGGLMVIHLRSQGDAWLQGLEEAIAIAGEADVALHLSHLCSLGRRNWPNIPRALERLAEARATGQPITFDQHPYTAASTLLTQVLPPWALEGGVGEMSERLADAAVRDRIRAEIAGPGRSGWENYAGLAGWESVQIAGVSRPANQTLVGRTIGAVAAERRVDPFGLCADLLVAEEGTVPMVLLGMFDDAGILEIMRTPGGSIGTDGVIAPFPHPRLFGTTARVLGRYARELGGLSLDAATRRLGSDGARILGLPDRGTIAAGQGADLVAFDPATIADRATYADPRQHPIGIAHVLVNGRFVVRDGRETGERPGWILRRAS